MATKANDAPSVTRVVLFILAFTRKPQALASLLPHREEVEGADVFVADANKAGWNRKAGRSEAGGFDGMEFRAAVDALGGQFAGGLAGLDIQIVDNEGVCQGHLADKKPTTLAKMAMTALEETYEGQKFSLSVVYLEGNGLDDEQKADEKKIAVQQTASQALRTAGITTQVASE